MKAKLITYTLLLSLLLIFSGCATGGYGAGGYGYSYRDPIYGGPGPGYWYPGYDYYGDYYYRYFPYNSYYYNPYYYYGYNYPGRHHVPARGGKLYRHHDRDDRAAHSRHSRKSYLNRDGYSKGGHRSGIKAFKRRSTGDIINRALKK